MAMIQSKTPWESLKFISKIEVVPGPGQKEVHARYEEDYEYEITDLMLSSRVISRDRTLHLLGETLNFHTDYPDDFKKLVHVAGGDYMQAYTNYQALRSPVPADWDAVPAQKESWDPCECGCDD